MTYFIIILKLIHIYSVTVSKVDKTILSTEYLIIGKH